MIALLRGAKYREDERRARKRHRCAWCRGDIEPGDLYVVATEFPGGDAGYADTAGHPVRMAVHRTSPCYSGPQPGDPS